MLDDLLAGLCLTAVTAPHRVTIKAWDDLGAHSARRKKKRQSLRRGTVRILVRQLMAVRLKAPLIT